MMINRSFEELKKVLTSKSPPLNLKLNPGTTDSVIGSIESELMLELPSDLKELLHLANGQSSNRPDPLFPRLNIQGFGLSDTCWFSSIEEIGRNTQIFRDSFEDLRSDGPFDELGPTHFHAGLVSISCSWNASSLYLDLMPRAGGIRGQVVMMCEQPGVVAVVASSLNDFLNRLVDGFRGDRFVRDPFEDYQIWIER